MPPLIIAFRFAAADVSLLPGGSVPHRIGFYLVATRERESAAKGCRCQHGQSPADGCRCLGRVDSVCRHFPCDVPDVHRARRGVLAAAVDPDCDVRADRGLGTVFGPLLGVIMLVPLWSWLAAGLARTPSVLHGFVYGAALIVVVLFMPNGLMGSPIPVQGTTRNREGTWR